MNKKILVTGANGYLGQGIVKQLLDDGLYVIATDFDCTNIDIRAEYIAANLFELDNPYEFFGKPDLLLHLAWRDGFKHDSVNHLNDLPMHYNFIKSMVDSGILHLSIMGSIHEIGFYEGSVNEFTPAMPQSLYGICKNTLRQLTELLVKDKNICFQWIRGYYIVGNTHSGCSVFSKITRAAESGQKEFPFVTGINQFDFLDYDDFCLKTASIVEQESISGIINCCSGRPERLGERVERFIKENGYSIQLQYGTFKERPYDSKAIWGNSKKIDLIMDRRNSTASAPCTEGS